MPKAKPRSGATRSEKKQWLLSLLPDELRVPLLGRLAAGMQAAAAAGPQSWALTAPSSDSPRVSLTCGFRWWLTLFASEMELTVDADLVDQGLLRRWASRGVVVDRGVHPKVPDRRAMWIRAVFRSARDTLAFSRDIESAHMGAIRLLAGTQLNPASQSSHDTLLTDALSGIAGIPSIQPGYSRQRGNAGDPATSRGPSSAPSGEPALAEGRIVTRLTSAAERSPRARAAAIALHGAVCRLCGFDFGAVYGPKAAGLVHVHHLHAIAKGRRVTDPATDLVPLCANCHMVVHSREPMLDLDVVRAMLGDRARRE